jgi:hypothetical protein
VVATAVHADGDGRRLLRVAARDGYEVLSESVPCEAGPDETLRALDRTEFGALPAEARGVVHRQVTDVLARAAED